MRLELSSEGRYALRALLYLARVGERVPAQRISAEAHVPRRLLARILANLSRAGLVESEQGRNGGSKLARPAGRISLREAVEAVEGPFGVTNCISGRPRLRPGPSSTSSWSACPGASIPPSVSRVSSPSAASASDSPSQGRFSRTRRC